jgi:hypothetical protein
VDLTAGAVVGDAIGEAVGAEGTAVVDASGVGVEAGGMLVGPRVDDRLGVAVKVGGMSVGMVVADVMGVAVEAGSVSGGLRVAGLQLARAKPPATVPAALRKSRREIARV